MFTIQRHDSIWKLLGCCYSKTCLLTAKRDSLSDNSKSGRLFHRTLFNKTHDDLEDLRTYPKLISTVAITFINETQLIWLSPNNIDFAFVFAIFWISWCLYDQIWFPNEKELNGSVLIKPLWLEDSSLHTKFT